MDQDNKGDFAVQSIRIGKIEFEPKERCVVSSNGIVIYGPDTKENIVIYISEDEVSEINCYVSDELCVLFLSVTEECYANMQENLKTDDSDDSENDYQIILKLNSKISEALQSLQPVFGSRIIDLDENEYIDAVDQFFERNDPVILVYPPPHVAPQGIPICRTDYKCLAVKKPINDVMVDFYLKYLHIEILTEAQRDRTYIFSMFFYSRLAASQHDKVARWTRNVNLFDKDFIIIPMNIDKQWVLAMVCFPNPSASDKDPTKKSCILVFDSLLSDSWDEVAITLRKYLTSEYKAKLGTDHEFNRENMPNYDVDVMEQDNIYDSGLYMLQCAESFFKNPIKDYQSLAVLNQQLDDWFDNDVIRAKRQAISALILALAQKYNPKVLPLPQLNTQATHTVDLCEVDSEEDDEIEESEQDEESEEGEQENHANEVNEIICLDVDDDDDDQNEPEVIEEMDISISEQ